MIQNLLLGNVVVGRIYNSFIISQKEFKIENPQVKNFKEFLEYLKTKNLNLKIYGDGLFHSITLIDGVPGNFTHAPLSAFLQLSI